MYAFINIFICIGQVLAKVRRMVVAHVPMDDTPEVLSHLSIFPRTGELGIVTEPPWNRAGPCLPARISLDLSLLHAGNPTWRALCLL